MANNYLDSKFIAQLKKDYQQAVVSRRLIIQKTADILSSSKAAIFACHRGELEKAKQELSNAGEIINQLGKEAITSNKLNFEGSLRAALEEFLEASLVYNFLTEGKVGEVKAKDIPFDHELYIGALSDLTGELLRLAVAKATKREVEDVSRIKEVIEEIVGHFIQFDLLSSQRNKFDQAKKNLRSVEEILYDLSLRRQL